MSKKSIRFDGRKIRSKEIDRPFLYGAVPSMLPQEVMAKLIIEAFQSTAIYRKKLIIGGQADFNKTLHVFVIASRICSNLECDIFVRQILKYYFVRHVRVVIIHSNKKQSKRPVAKFFSTLPQLQCSSVLQAWRWFMEVDALPPIPVRQDVVRLMV